METVNREIIQEREITRTGSPSRESLMVSRIVGYLLDFVEIVLGMRFVFKLLGANAVNGFVRTLYGFTEPLVWPFRGIFPAYTVPPNAFEWPVVIAMIIYAIGAYLLLRLLRFMTSDGREVTTFQRARWQA
jgi:hypothetical protein